MSRAKNSRKVSINRRLRKKGLPQLRKPGDPTSLLNSILVKLSEKTEQELEYWRIYQNYLTNAREARKDRILDSLKAASTSGYENDRLVRIVDTRYQTRPLSSYGSVVVPPGGRFNFGDIAPYHQKFQALYLASDFRTAAAERFLRHQTESESVDQDSLDLRLDPNASFSSYRVRVSNLNVIDIQSDENLQPFLDVIAEIDPPSWLAKLARQHRQPLPRTVKTMPQLRGLLFDPLFTQYGSLIDQPSSSQWFGHYVREAGLHGIVYPSVRNNQGFNLAVFPDCLKDTNGRVELLDVAEGVKAEDSVLDGSNAMFHMQKSLADHLLVQ